MAVWHVIRRGWNAANQSSVGRGGSARLHPVETTNLLQPGECNKGEKRAHHHRSDTHERPYTSM